jgi:hypothetical protein
MLLSFLCVVTVLLLLCIFHESILKLLCWIDLRGKRILQRCIERNFLKKIPIMFWKSLFNYSIMVACNEKFVLSFSFPKHCFSVFLTNEWIREEAVIFLFSFFPNTHFHFSFRTKYINFFFRSIFFDLILLIF